ncbi:nucleoside triphosphate pyrophosphohydrolase [Rossellomorea aquimaris]|uniref:Tetrapyrrole methylase family protein/MazG family protein n=1 Tax=Rossellomorea aquimaris TaxID=189382 RepID=A0A366EHT9_9BACI|nr:nucleoside triphosphate pyrophosphohydrolase [Rossellomorea aquimaris]RBP01009.1 tetrapyrrole methylase family protein/MazG family protein [Rossellomorea aquimaris]
MHTITIVGLGAGDIEQLPLGVYRLLKNSSHLYLRTKEHPVVKDLTAEGVEFQSFDAVYEKHEQFDHVYEEIVRELVSKSEKHSIVYAVPGHPLVAEKAVQMLLDLQKEGKIQVSIGGGQSFIDALFASVGADPIDGFQLLDGTNLKLHDIHMNQQLIIGQVYDAFIASEVKITLMELYPYDYEVMLVTAAGSKEEKVDKIPLVELDRVAHLSNLTSLYVPAVKERESTYKQYATLREIISTLRGPNGCPWDKEQTHHSLKKYLLEETYELLEAIEEDDIDHMIEELGDVLLQVMLHAQIGEDEGMFTMEEVIESLASKMVRRHPHVFGSVQVENTEQVKANWDEIKKQEKSDEHEPMLKNVAKGMPALMKAYEYQKKAAKVGFDWPDPKGAWEKVWEELKEFENEVENNSEKDIKKEFGDILFALINVARFYKIFPEEALSMTNTKFYRRFSYVEEQVLKTGKSFEDFTLEELDQFWNEAKKMNIE